MNMECLPSREQPPGVGGRIAVIGSGISGLAAAWLLSKRYTVSLFESAGRAGGHTNTVDVVLDGFEHPVDTGFLVFNRRTYPQLCAMFEHLGVASAPSEMSFSVSLRRPGLEWAGHSLNTVFAQRRNLVNPRVWRMLSDMLRFNRAAAQMVAADAIPDVSLGDYLVAQRYGSTFRGAYLLPMAAAIWSCPVATMLEYPLSSFVRFCHNHGLVQLFGRPQWLTVKGGGRQYVDRLLEGVETVCLGTPVRRVERDAEGVWLHHDRAMERFDAVVFACHSDQTLRLLGDQAEPQERSVLTAVPYQSNQAVLHTDTRLMPRHRSVWAAWNYLGEGGESGAVSVTYWLNRLQSLPFSSPLMVSLNPLHAPREACVLDRFEFAHPAFGREALRAQQRLPALQGRRHSWFAGAWTGFGFHEDGLRSAVAVAEAMGVRAPWADDARASGRCS